MAGHTKGPLYAIRKAWGSVVATKPNGKYADKVTECTAWINGAPGQPTLDEAHENALLFAAAPDLLEAIQPLAPADDATAEHFANMDPDDTVTITVPVRCILKARAAITRARTGEGG